MIKQLLGLVAAMAVPVLLHAETVNLGVANIDVRKGSISNQNVNVLNSRTLTGNQDDWSTYIELAPDSNRFVGLFDFKAPQRQGWSKLVVNANTIGEAASVQRWRFQLRDFTNKRWLDIGNNNGASDWLWHGQAMPVGQSISNYINGNGRIRIRYFSNNATDVSNIDQLTVALTKPNTGNDQWWQPTPEDKLTWQWQINGNLNTSLDVDMYDVDLFDTSAATIQNLKNDGRIVVCYFSAGTYEGWRDDWATHFPFITGDDYSGSQPPFAGNMADWDERWLDIRRIDLLQGIMSARMDLAVEKGCDAVEPDNMDAYTNGDETGINLTAQDQLDYNRWIANLAHSKGLSVGLKNDVEQVTELVGDFDWALNEQCYQYNECDVYDAFTDAGKAVFGVEYQGGPAKFCPYFNAKGFSWLKKSLALNAWRQGCEDF
ncbi:endo alpha-1,4 polygalactosaminidase [Halioxenophilus aromaticivorans]|uniref:Glycoside-hydrolase family GH114 TIM-barrel domain-containing protein n=1 Tax=Halioxenophilus aromaticivorans TaxID=1306992 RepID=A0AAV3U608_9ALTE